MIHAPFEHIPFIGEPGGKDYKRSGDKIALLTGKVPPSRLYSNGTTSTPRYTSLAIMARQALVILFTVFAFGILVPWYKGFAFVDARMIAAYGCLALLFVAPASAETSAANPGNGSPTALIGRLAGIVAYGWGVTVITLITAFITLNVTHGPWGAITPPYQLCAAVLSCSLTGSIAVAFLSALLARRFSANAGKSIVRLAFLLLLLSIVFSSRLPEEWQIFLGDHTTRRAITRLAWESSLVFAIIAGLLLIPILRKSPATHVPPPVC